MVEEEGRLRRWVGEAVEGGFRLLVVVGAQVGLQNWGEMVLSAHSSVEEVVERVLKWVGEEAALERSSVVRAVERVLK